MSRGMVAGALITLGADGLALLCLAIAARFGWAAITGERWFRAYRAKMCIVFTVLGGVLVWLALLP